MMVMIYEPFSSCPLIYRMSDKLPYFMTNELKLIIYSKFINTFNYVITHALYLISSFPFLDLH